MEVYSKKLIFDYVNGNDIYGCSVDELEDNPEFMMDVIKYTKDKRMYDLCSDRVKNNHKFVKFMIETFKDDVDFVTSLALNYLNKVNEESITYKEILVLTSELIGDCDNLIVLKLKQEIFKTLEIGSIESALKDESDYKVKKELGMGFIYIIDNYGNSDIIKNYFAKEFIEKIFYNNDITLEELIHKQVKNFNKLKKQGINIFLINYIEMYDHYLAAHISNHIDLLEKLKKEIIKVCNNWDKYIENINRRRINILNQEVYNYVDENHVILSFGVYQLIMYVMKKYDLEDIFNKYDNNQNFINENQIDISNIDENKMNLMELKCFKYISDLVVELFNEDIIDKSARLNEKKQTNNGNCKILAFKTVEK